MARQGAGAGLRPWKGQGKGQGKGQTLGAWCCVNRWKVLSERVEFRRENFLVIQELLFGCCVNTPKILGLSVVEYPPNIGQNWGMGSGLPNSYLQNGNLQNDRFN